MPKTITKLTRREFCKLTGVAGMGSLVPSIGKPVWAAENSTPSEMPRVPRRPFGRTGESVPILGLGGSQDLMSKQLLLRQALRMGVTYWDTADSYEGGNSEKAIGRYLARYPDDRKNIFLVTKSSSSRAEQLTGDLNDSLKRLNTSYVDLYFIHHVSNVQRDLTPEIKTWADRAKSRGRIRFFGFSTHSNMDRCLRDAAALGWVDGIMTSYNYRLMTADEMRRAVDACAAAGIGLTAMKTQARFFSFFYADIGKKEAEAEKLSQHFASRGFTPEQAKLKAVWDNPAIASICSEMPSMRILQENVAASLDRPQLSLQDRQQLEHYAEATAFGYCTGCSRICESAMSAAVPVSAIMRCLMYDQAYGKHETAAECFREIGPDIRRQMLHMDYSKAERRCPQNMPIAGLMRRASERFA